MSLIMKRTIHVGIIITLVQIAVIYSDLTQMVEMDSALIALGNINILE